MGIIAWIAVGLIVGLLAKLPSRVGSLMGFTGLVVRQTRFR